MPPPPKYALVSTFRPIKVWMVDFQKKVCAVRDETPYFFEALGFTLPCLLVNPALSRSHIVTCDCPCAKQSMTYMQVLEAIKSFTRCKCIQAAVQNPYIAAVV